MELGSSRPRQTVVDRTPNQLVREPVSQPAARKLLDGAAAHRFVQGREKLALVESSAAENDFELELGASGGRELEHLGGYRCQAREPLTDDLADALRRPELGDRACQPDDTVADFHSFRLHERPPQLTNEKRSAAGELADRPRDLSEMRAGLTLRNPFHELAHLLV